MSLQKYNQKRDFKQTSEPAGKKDKKSVSNVKAAQTKASKEKLAFVVQRHQASHLHYDFRLEMDGVLKSWAVPKGPSLDPSDKRLAIMVEDHPFEYRTFEGRIPKGNYGAGVVEIFDDGFYEALDDPKYNLKKGLKSGNLKFLLKGKKLKGEFALVKIKHANDDKDNAWLLIKHKDEYAVSGGYDAEEHVGKAKRGHKKAAAGKEKAAPKAKVAAPKAKVKAAKKATSKSKPEVEPSPLTHQSLKPMLAKLGSAVPEGKDWIFEEKLDGYRAIAQVKEKEVFLDSRNGHALEEDYPKVVKALQKLGIWAVLDGEVVVREGKRTNFQLLQQYVSGGRKGNIQYVIFDVLEIQGEDVRHLNLSQRKQLLDKLMKEALKVAKLPKEVKLVEGDNSSGSKLFKKARKLNWEGIIAKQVDSTYASGLRSSSWLKIKLQQSIEAFILGYTASEAQAFGSLVLGMEVDDELVYIGNCGTGFNAQSMQDLMKLMKPLETNKKPVKETPGLGKMGRQVTWIKPELLCEVNFSEWTDAQHLRHPVFKGLRQDKEVNESTGKAKSNVEEAEVLKYGKKTVKLTNPQKIYWPVEKITKGDMLNYYKKVADFILPHLKDRPLSLNRHPNGINEAGFFQKDLNTDQIPAWIKTAPLRSSHLEKEIDYLVCNDEATLLWMANLGCIEINPWMSTYKKPDEPLFAVLDLDPQGVDFKDVVKVALTAKDILDELKIISFVKTSGSRGMHIVIPLAKYDYEVSKNFVHYLGGRILEIHPDLCSLERSPSKRKNKIYLDFLQNRRGQTIVAPYSLRPKPGATVSMPLQWEEVNAKLKISDFTIFNALKRLEKVGDIWADMYKVKNKINLV
ncbi:MAG: DNA ligase D [Pedobacter sp.]|nr:MAG: DNA ligase D [Pedobacter sp.]